jgi:hypothetical protein
MLWLQIIGWVLYIVTNWLTKDNQYDRWKKFPTRFVQYNSFPNCQSWTPDAIAACRSQDKLAACSLGLSATSQQYFSLTTNHSPATSQQYFSLRTNQHQPPAKRTECLICLHYPVSSRSNIWETHQSINHQVSVTQESRLNGQITWTEL